MTFQALQRRESAFEFEGSQVRWSWRDGVSWFVLADVCQALELRDPSMAANRLDADEKGTSTIGTPGGPQEMLIVSEPGLYKLIGASRKPIARRFDRWVRHEVLPEVRRTGSYGAGGDQSALLTIVTEIAERVRFLFEEATHGREIITPKTKAEHRRIVLLGFHRHCPIYSTEIILDENGDIILDDHGRPIAEYDHHRGRHLSGLDDTWLISLRAHRELSSRKLARGAVEPIFNSYHWQGKQLSPVRLVSSQPAPLPQPELPLPSVPPSTEQRQPDTVQEPVRAVEIAQIIYWRFGNVASNKQIAEVYAQRHPEVANPDASVRNGILRQRLGSKEHLGHYRHTTTLFRLADGYEVGVTSCTEAGVEVAERAGPLDEGCVP